MAALYDYAYKALSDFDFLIWWVPHVFIKIFV